MTKSDTSGPEKGVNCCSYLTEQAQIYLFCSRRDNIGYEICLH